MRLYPVPTWSSVRDFSEKRRFLGVPLHPANLAFVLLIADCLGANAHGQVETTL
jgi:hypothetical protein